MNQNSNSDSSQAAFRAPQQERSRATLERLFAAGRILLGERDFDAITISELARAAKCSVGAFYVRFENKDAYFAALTAHMLDQERQTLLHLHEAETGDAVAVVIGNAVRAFRANAGIIRAAIRKGMEGPEFWAPFRAHGQFAADLFADRLRGEGAIDESRMRFAFQVLYGTLINALLHQPGPLLLDDPRLEAELARVFAATASGATPPRSSPADPAG